MTHKRAPSRGRAAAWSAVLALAMGCGWAAAEPPAPATQPAGSEPRAEGPGPIRLKYLTIDRAKRQIILEANVCYHPGPLEVLVCLRGTKEHESILTTMARPSDLHAALLALGLTPGKPARMSKAITQPARFLPPAGPELKIALRWTDKDGKARQAEAGDWLTNLGEHKTRPPAKWIFVGSEVLPGGAYWADEDGAVVSVSNFPSAVIDVPFESTADNAALEFTGKAEAIPPLGTAVEVVITVPEEARRAPAARVMMDIDRFGRFWIDGKQYAADELTPWATRYIEDHAEGQVVLRAHPGAEVQDVERARDRLQMGGVADLDEQRLVSPSDPPPRTAEQARSAIETWRRRFANAERMLTDPVQDAEEHLRQIDREVLELEARKAMLGEYKLHLAEALARHKASTQPAGERSDSPPDRISELRKHFTHTVRDEQTLPILIKPTIVILPEEEEKPFP